jgi:hypothetical protein
VAIYKGSNVNIHNPVNVLCATSICFCKLLQDASLGLTPKLLECYKHILHWGQKIGRLRVPKLKLMRLSAVVNRYHSMSVTSASMSTIVPGSEGAFPANIREQCNSWLTMFQGKFQFQLKVLRGEGKICSSLKRLF